LINAPPKRLEMRTDEIGCDSRYVLTVPNTLASAARSEQRGLQGVGVASVDTEPAELKASSSKRLCAKTQFATLQKDSR
jgi:hypothetical protein